MVVVSGTLTKRGTPERVAIESVPEAAALIPQIEAAHRGLLDSQPIANAGIAKLSGQLATSDGRHDTLVRAMHLRLESDILFADGDDDRADLTRARDALFPTGTSIITRSWTEQAGEARLRAARVTETVERTLTRMKTRGGSMLDRYTELQDVANEIDRLEKRRAGLVSSQPGGSETVKARNQWIRCVNALAMVLAAVGADEAPILGRCRALEARTEGRAQQPAPSEPSEPVAPEPPDSPEPIVITPKPSPDTPVAS